MEVTLLNYHILSTKDTLHINHSSIENTFLEFDEFYPPLPSFFSGELIIPSFVYNYTLNSKSHIAHPIKRPEYLSQKNGLLYPSQNVFKSGENVITKLGTVSLEGKKFFHAPNGNILLNRGDFYTQTGFVQGTKIVANEIKMEATSFDFFLFLRDIVHPNASQEDMISLISTLYFPSMEKKFLYKLLQIMYAGTQEDEISLVANLFAHEKEFALSLKKSLFSFRILPLIHGPFIHEILNRTDDQIIRNDIEKLPQSIQNIILANVSKKRQKYLQSLPLTNKTGLIEQVEKELQNKFSRKVYYSGNEYIIYNTNDASPQKSIETLPSEKVNFSITRPIIQFYGLTKNEVLFHMKESISTIRFDTFFGSRNWKSFEFKNIKAPCIFPLPYLPIARFTLAAGISESGDAFEIAIDYSEY